MRRANRLLERGIAYHPLDWRNRHYLGFNHFYHLGDQVRAAEVLETAIGLEGAPHYLAPLVAKLRAGAGSLDAAEALLVGLVNTTPDEYAKARYLKSLDEIDTERRARLLDEARVEYWRRHGRDLVRVEDLLRPPAPVLRQLPPAHPHFPGFGWMLDPETDQITSTFYGSRYRLFDHARDAQRLPALAGALERRGAGAGMSADAPPIVRIQGIVKDFRPGLGLRRRRVLHGISFAVREGEIFGFVGPNGAGKTTTLKILMGLIRPTAGAASILGHDVSETSFRRHSASCPRTRTSTTSSPGARSCASMRASRGCRDPGCARGWTRCSRGWG